MLVGLLGLFELKGSLLEVYVSGPVSDCFCSQVLKQAEPLKPQVRITMNVQLQAVELHALLCL